MHRSVTSILAFVLLASSVPAAAEEKAATGLIAPSRAVADAWAREDAESRSAKTAKALYVSYAGLQAADMASTIFARRAGAIETNPLMDTGVATASATKSLLTIGTLVAVKAVEKKNRKAAIVTMVALNSVMAMVVANNVRVVRRLR